MSSDLIFLKKKYSHLKEKALWSYRENGEGEHTRARFYSQYSHWSSNFFLLCFLLLRSIHSLSCLIRLQTFGVWEFLHTSSYCEIHPKLSPHNWILPWLDLQSWETVCVMKNVHNLVSSNFLCQKPLFHECFTLKKKKEVSFTLTFIYFSATVMLLVLIYFLLYSQQGACSFVQMHRSIFLQQSGGQILHLSVSIHGKCSGKIHALSGSRIFCGGSCCFSYCVL